MSELGAICFGLVIGWVTYRTLRRSEDKVGLSDIATVLGVVGGAAVTTLFEDSGLFGFYALGLAIGFFGYLIVAMIMEGKNVDVWMRVQHDSPSQKRTNVRPD